MKVMSERKYPLEWLDKFIEKLKSNPADESYTTDMSHQGIDMLSIAQNEIKRLKLRIREEIFTAAFPKKNKKLIANHYHETITYYMNIIYGIDHSQSDQGKTCIALQNLLRNLLDYLGIHFKDYLRSKRRIPKYDLYTAKNKLRGLLDTIQQRSRHSKCFHTRKVIEIVSAAIEKFINRSKYYYIVSYQCVQYREELLKKILALPQWEADEATGNFPLDTLLVYMNFNSKTYINYLTSCMTENMKSTGDSDKIELLLAYYKGLRQLHGHPNYAFNPEYESIKHILDKWFDEELNYYRKKVALNPINIGPRQVIESDKKLTVASKVICTLSGDQIALLIRAADEVRMLSAKSLTAAFRSIVPYVASKERDDLSYESLRIKSYSAEQTDKDVAIQILRKMIDKIQDY